MLIYINYKQLSTLLYKQIKYDIDILSIIQFRNKILVNNNIRIKI